MFQFNTKLFLPACIVVTTLSLENKLIPISFRAFIVIVYDANGESFEIMWVNVDALMFSVILSSALHLADMKYSSNWEFPLKDACHFTSIDIGDNALTETIFGGPGRTETHDTPISRLPHQERNKLILYSILWTTIFTNNNYTI